METALEQVRNQQRTTWDKFSGGWKKWDEIVLSWLAPVGEALIAEAALGTRSRVLDVASGTGEPGLTAAARCRDGRVTLTDLSPEMIRIAEANAAARGLGNVEARVCDAGALPFPDAEFDAVTSRFGFMFFPDIPATARELARVTRHGGRVTAAVWGAPAKNAWATTIMSTIAKHVDLPALPPDAPGLFRCAEPGFMARVFREAGLRDVREREVEVPTAFDEPAGYFEFMNDAAAPVVAGMAKADEATRAVIRAEVIRLAGERATSGKIRLGGCAVVVTGVR